jgi:hypothetical protein
MTQPNSGWRVEPPDGPPPSVAPLLESETRPWRVLGKRSGSHVEKVESYPPFTVRGPRCLSSSAYWVIEPTHSRRLARSGADRGRAEGRQFSPRGYNPRRLLARLLFDEARQAAREATQPDSSRRAAVELEQRERSSELLGKRPLARNRCSTWPERAFHLPRNRCSTWSGARIRLREVWRQAADFGEP